MAYTDEDKGLGDCDLCGEGFNLFSSRPSESEVGEFYRPNNNEPGENSEYSVEEHVIAHAQCGIDHGLEMA